MNYNEVKNTFRFQFTFFYQPNYACLYTKADGSFVVMERSVSVFMKLSIAHVRSML